MKTQIICTIGPATNTPEAISALVLAGMNIARVNCSHGTVEQSRSLVRMLKSAGVTVMLDTKGPDVRIGSFDGGNTTLVEGQSFVLTSATVTGCNNRVFAGTRDLGERVKIGDEVLLSDGKIRLRVAGFNMSRGTDVVTTVEVGGVLRDNKTIFVPGVDLGLPFLSDADKADIAMGVEEGVDIIAASFVTSTADVVALRTFMGKTKHKTPSIIAKIETAEGVANLDTILDVVDGIMVARGDLGMEHAVEKIPALQKQMVDAATERGKTVIVATEMMESMITNSRPTRAEVADVALSVWQGASAVMLSAETAVGKHPIRAVEYMRRAVAEAEQSGIVVNCVC